VQPTGKTNHVQKGMVPGNLLVLLNIHVKTQITMLTSTSCLNVTMK